MSEQKSSHSADLGAFAKIEIKTEVPAQSSGRAVDALTDLIRPLSESLGLFGDKIQLRRQETLLEIAKRIKQRAALTDKPINSIPPKFFIPLLEKASLENIEDDTLIEMWTSLLFTASTENVQMLGQYINILSNIIPRQVQILDLMMGISENEQRDSGHLIDNYYYLNQTGFPGTLAGYSHIKDAAEFCQAVTDALSLEGVTIETINVYYRKKRAGSDFSVSYPDGHFSDDDFLDFENLVRLGLIDRTEIKRHAVGAFDIDVHYYIVNPVGIDLFACCNPNKLTRLR